MNLSSRNFSMDIIDYYANETNFICFSSYNKGVSSSFGTFEETITEKENSSFNLSFKMELFNVDTRNPYIDYLTHGRQIRLTIDTQVIYFNITSIKPILNIKGVQYEYNCTDSFSYQLSRQSINSSFDTNDSSMWEEIGPKSIDQLIDKLLAITSMNTHWTLDLNAENHIREFPDNMYTNTGRMKVSISISDTTPYSILKEILNAFDAGLNINYETGILTVFNKERKRTQGLQLRPEINLNSFSYAESSEDMYNIMHVTGGENSYGGLVSMIDPIPPALCDLLINLDHDNPQNPNTIIDSSRNTKEYSIYYPDFIIGTDKQTIYRKSLKDEKLTYVQHYVDGKVDTRDWKKCANSSELEILLSSYYRAFQDKSYNPDGVLLNRLEDYSEFLNFFTTLNKLPYFASFLCDFTYWEKTILKPERANNLHKRLNYDLRNINMLLYVYSSIYNKQKYLLDQKIYREEEIINNIASLKCEKANLENDKEGISLYSYYASLSVQAENKKYVVKSLEAAKNTSGLCGSASSPSLIVNAKVNDICIITNEEETNSDGSTVSPTYWRCKRSYSNLYLTTDNYKIYWSQLTEEEAQLSKVCFSTEENNNIFNFYNYYLPVSDWEHVDGTNIHYNKFKEACITLPSLTDIVNNKNYDLYYFKNSEWVPFEGSVTPNIIENKFIITDEYKPSESTRFYILLNNFTESFSSNVISQDGVLDNEISSLLFELQNMVWNQEYITLYNSLYGSNWLQDKIQKLNNNIITKQREAKSYINKMKNTFGDNWRDLEVNGLSQFNISNSILYSDYLNLINNCGIYIGGLGTRKNDTGQFMSYPGYLIEYQTLLESILSKKINHSNTNKATLQEKVDYYTQQQKLWWKDFYKDFFDVISETSFSDTDQLTSAGLYNTALKQFLVYQKPTTSYDASHISAEELEYSVSNINVGDVVLLKAPELNVQHDPKSFIAELDSPLKALNKVGVNYVEYKNISYALNHKTHPTGSHLRGVAYGNGYLVGVGTDGFWEYSSDNKNWDKGTNELPAPSGNNTFTGIVYWKGHFLATRYGGNDVLELHVPTKDSSDSETTVFASGLEFSPEGIKIINDECFIFGTNGKIWKMSSEKSFTQLVDLNTTEFITDITYSNSYYLFTSNRKLYYTTDFQASNIYVGYDASKDSRESAGGSPIIDLRAIYADNNKIILGGKLIGIIVADWQYIITQSTYTSNAAWLDKNIPVSRDKNLFIRDIEEKNGILFAVGYNRLNEPDARDNGLIWKSSNKGNSWQPIVEIENLEKLISNQLLFDIEVHNDSVYFISNKNIIEYIASPQYKKPILVNKISPLLIEVKVDDENFSFPESNVIAVTVDNQRYSFDPLQKHIVSLSKKTNPQFIKLRIESITKSLRSNKTTLKIEENHMYNMLVDRLIYFLRFK